MLCHNSNICQHFETNYGTLLYATILQLDKSHPKSFIRFIDRICIFQAVQDLPPSFSLYGRLTV